MFSQLTLYQMLGVLKDPERHCPCPEDSQPGGKTDYNLIITQGNLRLQTMLSRLQLGTRGTERGAG